MKKVSFLFMVLVLLLGLTAPPQTEAATYRDVPPGHWAAKEISYLSDLGILKGGSNGKFNKDAPVTKAQAAAILARAKKLSLAGAPNPGFSDVPVTHPFYKEIAAAVNAGWFSKGASFQPNNQLKRIEMAKITQLAFGVRGSVPVEWEDMSPAYPGYPYVTPLLANGITSGYTATKFNPTAKVTRAQFAVFIARAMNPTFRMKVVTYPKKAAADLFYPQFVDTTRAHDFTYLNAFYREEGQSLVNKRNEIMELAREDDQYGEYYSYGASYKVTRADLRFISVVFDSYEYTGGAHGYGQLFSYNYDVSSNRFISLDDLATKANYERAVINRINAMNAAYYPYFGGPESLDELQHQFYMTSAGFVMYLNPYEYAPYAAGIREYEMPYSMIR